MKRWIFIVFSILMVLLFVAGCTPKIGYIVRDDISLEDLGFFKKEDGFIRGLTQEDIIRVMGMPYYRFSNSGARQFSYYIKNEKNGMGIIMFMFDGNGDLVNADWNAEKNMLNSDDIEPAGAWPDLDRIQKPLRYDIQEAELDIIDEKVTASGIQQVLGAPHGWKKLGEDEDRIIMYRYPLVNENELWISYRHGGYILKAWLMDKSEEIIEELVNQGYEKPE